MTTVRSNDVAVGLPAKEDARTSPNGQTMRTKTIVHKSAAGKRKRRILIAAAVIVLAALALWLYMSQGGAKSTTTIRYAAVERGDITRAVTATGTLQATKTVQVGSQVSGTIQTMTADFNSHVTKGQLLATLDPTFYEAAVNEASANLAKANAELSNAEREEARAKDLVARDLISRQEYDVTKTRLLNTQATVRQVKAQLERAQVNLGYTTIRSPISGVVVSRDVDVGQTVAASLNAPVLFTIAEDLRKMQVSANVDEADIGQVQMGQTVKFTVDAFPGEPFTGVVQQIRLNPTTQQNVVTYSVIIDAENQSSKLLPGLTATVNIVSDSRENVLKVPAAAMRFVPPDDTTAQRGGRRQGTGGAGATGVGNGAGRGAGAQQGGAMRANRPARIYIKDAKAKNGLQMVVATVGISDGSTVEIVSSNPAIKPGDSIAVGSITLGADAAAGRPGQAPNPLTQGASRGGGGRGMRF